MTLARRVCARDDADQRRLAGAVVAADGDDLSRQDIDIDAVERLDGAVAFADADEAEERRRAHFVIWSTLPASTSTASMRRKGPATTFSFGTFLTTMSFIASTAV